MKKTIIIACLLLTGSLLRAQGVGLNCQYFPGVQFGFVSVKSSGDPRYSKYKFGAGIPLLMIDRLTNHWYTHLDMNALYYSATQTNKANDDRIKISKAEGGLFAGRVGYLFGDGDSFRFGVNGNLGYMTSNLDSLKRPFKQRGYYDYGLGVLAYKKFGKFRVVGKVGYELYRKKNFLTKSHGMYFEGTIAYSFYQKYGLSLMPCLYTKTFNYMPVDNGSGSAPAEAKAKVRSFVLRLGLTKFF